jgi:hypothetical protein
MPAATASTTAEVQPIHPKCTAVHLERATSRRSPEAAAFLVIFHGSTGVL